MRALIVALAVLAATPAVADDLRNQVDGRHQSRAFWMHNQGFPITGPVSSSKPIPQQFTKTYVEGIASRFSLGAGGHFDVFERKLGGAYGLPAPAVVGTFDHGAAMVALRWRPGE
jgi:hypothetical protein